jgi:hypothetical protein
MGQYYKIVNIDKQEYISPSDFGSGVKLMEFAYPGNPSMVLSALAILLADGNNRGGGDLRSDNSVIGNWKYDRVAIVGDYADPHPECQNENFYFDTDRWENISDQVWAALLDDRYFAHEYRKKILYFLETDQKYYIPKRIVEFATFQDNSEAFHELNKLFPDEETRTMVIESIKEN